MILRSKTKANSRSKLDDYGSINGDNEDVPVMNGGNCATHLENSGT